MAITNDDASGQLLMSIPKVLSLVTCTDVYVRDVDGHNKCESLFAI